MSSQKLIAIVVVFLLAAFLLSGANTIPTQQEKVNAAWAQVDNQYQRRMDLIPNLVKTVQGSANFEKSTLQAVIDARARATSITVTPETLQNPEAFKQYEAAQNGLQGALSHLLAVSENYPALKASENFLSLQSQLEGTENRISVARRDYILTVQEYNTTLRTFPGVIWAKIYGSKPRETFTSTSGADKPPAVNF